MSNLVGTGWALLEVRCVECNEVVGCLLYVGGWAMMFTDPKVPNRLLRFPNSVAVLCPGCQPLMG